MSTFTDGDGVDVVERNRRSVHGNGNALGVGGGTGLIAFAHRGRGHHAVGGGGIGINLQACTIAVGDGGVALIPNVGEFAGMGCSGNFKSSGTTLADGSRSDSV